MPWTDRIGRRLNLRDLHILLAVAKSGSMGKAAAELAISQPSVSKAIAAVEHAVGLRLLDRGAHGVEPTVYGRALLRCGVAVFDELRQGVSALDFLTDAGTGELRIGCSESLAAGFISTVTLTARLVLEKLQKGPGRQKSPASIPFAAHRCANPARAERVFWGRELLADG